MSTAGRPTTAEWLGRLVAYKTVVGASNVALIDDVRGYLDARGAQTRVIPGTRPGTANLYATIGPTDRRGVVLSAHTDVVPAPSEGWTSDPFVVTPRDGRFYGRGTSDMKGFIAVVLAAVPSVAALELKRPVCIALSADEEMGVRGVGPMLDVIAATAPMPMYCIVGEPTRMRVAVAHKGKVALGIALRGRAAHSSLPGSGVSAIDYAVRIVSALLSRVDALSRETRDPRFSVPHTSINVGRITGGTAVNMVADRCELEVEFRLVPAQSAAAMIGIVQETVQTMEREMRRTAPDSSIALSVLSSYPGLESRGDIPRIVAEFAETEHGLCVDFGTEAGLYQQRLGVPTVVCGPGDVAQAHTIDEFIDCDQLAHCERFIQRIASRMCHT